MSREIIQRNLQLDPLEVSPIQLQMSDSLMEGRPAIPAGTHVGGLLWKRGKIVGKLPVNKGHLVSGSVESVEALAHDLRQGQLDVTMLKQVS